VSEKEFYSSSNGDRWFLCRSDRDGQAFVRHQANEPSGGNSTHVEIGRFLLRGPTGPEHSALLALIGTLVEEPADADRT
jgi:hypothetical protein